MPETPYVPRILDARLRDDLATLPAVVVEGPKAVGKTRTAQRLVSSEFRLARAEVAQNLAGGTDVIEKAAPPVLIDEWQRVPRIWDDVREWVDADPTPGRFLLTGSAAPRDVPMHSGAGRIVSMRMRPLSLAERDFDRPSVSVAELVNGSGAEVGGATEAGLADYVAEITASGFPAIRSLGSSKARSRALDGYVDAIVTKEFPDQGLMVRKPEALLGWMRGYALATGSTSSYNAILDAATTGESDKPAKSTALAYRDTLASLWMLDPVPAWRPVANGPGVPLASSPKHFLADPALATRLLDVDDVTLVAGSRLDPLGPQAGPLLGRLFEALVALNLQTYAQACDARLSHLRTANGQHEVDFLVTRRDRVVAIEVKLARSVDGRDVRHLNWLESVLPAYRVTKVCVTTGPWAFTRDDGVHVVPAALLGP